MNSNLIPAQITDKNGHLTTRWVKPADENNGKALNLPIPALSTPPAVNYRKELASLLADKVREFGDNHTRFYKKASEDILSYIHEALTDENAPDALTAQISCLMNDEAEDHVIEAWIHLYDVHKGTMDDMAEVDYIRGAIESGTEPLNSYDRANPDHERIVSTIFKFLCEGDSEAHGTRLELRENITTNGIQAMSHRITNPHLADYLIDHPEQVDSLIIISNEHPEWLHSDMFSNSYDLPEIIREYLDTSAPLQRGVL